MKRLLALAVFFFCVSPFPHAHAADLLVPKPTIARDESQLLPHYTTQTSMTTEGKGGYLHIVYSSSQPFDLLIAPFRSSRGYLPIDLSRVHMPAGKHRDVRIDLTGSPLWSPGQHKYYLLFGSAQKSVDTAVEDMSFLPTPLLQVPIIAVRQFFEAESYQISSYHTLLGYRVLTVSVTLLGGCIVLLTLLMLLIRKAQPSTLLGVLVLAMLAYNMRFSLDLIRFTAHHLQQWYGEGLYSRAGAVVHIAQDVQADQQKHSFGAPYVYVCTDDTNYYAKMLRYHAYPVTVATDLQSDAPLTHVLVHHSQWSETGGTLHCGQFEGTVRKLADYPDNTHLYSLLPAE